jgi:hypothetical protein
MSTPRELLGVRDDLAKKVAERQLGRHDAVADLRAEVSKYPELLGKLADDWADTEIDRGVKRYVARRNVAADAAIVRKLAEMGLERPTLDGDVIPISQYDESYSVTLADYREYMSTNLASSWRLLKSFESREEDHELLTAAVDGNLSATREQALDVLKGLPEAKRKALRTAAKAKLSAERSAFLQQRYGDYGQASEG